MGLTEIQKDKIKQHILLKVRNKLKDYNPETSSMPFHFRLLGKDRMAVYSFIQSINTTLGTSIFEQIGQIVAEPSAKRAVGQYKDLEGYISSDAVLTIDRIMRDLRSSQTIPNKNKEVEEILSVAKTGILGKKMKKRVDLFVESADDVEFYYEIKSAKPNIDQFVSIKKQLLDWVAMRGSISDGPKVKTIVAIPYNPYEPRPYERWTLQGLFDLNHEILVGSEFWDFLGGVGVYEELLSIFEEAGLELNKEIDDRIKISGNLK